MPTELDASFLEDPVQKVRSEKLQTVSEHDRTTSSTEDKRRARCFTRTAICGHPPFTSRETSKQVHCHNSPRQSTCSRGDSCSFKHDSALQVRKAKEEGNVFQSNWIVNFAGTKRKEHAPRGKACDYRRLLPCIHFKKGQFK